MSRPDDHRGRIGSATSPERNRKRERIVTKKREEYYRLPSREIRPRSRTPPHPSRKAPRFVKDEHGRDRFSLKVYQKITDICGVKDYVIRDGQQHEFDNFYEFLKKLLESVNVSLSTKFPRGRYVEKKLSVLISPVSIDEQKRLAVHSRYHKHQQCHMVVLGLPKSIFMGNGFGISKDDSSVYAAAKDLIEKIHRIGFVSQKLYEVIEKDHKFNHNRKLPDFSKAIECFISFERELFDVQGGLRDDWPRDLLEAIDQPPQLFDKLSLTFKKIAQEVHGANPVVQKNGIDDDIERKIARQREELLRRERARDMIEPLDDGPLMTPVQPTALAWDTTRPYEMIANRPMFNMAVPPVGVVDPAHGRGAGARGLTSANRAVDMDIEKHPYRRGRDGESERKSRKEERRQLEEAMLMKRKEEELERKIKEEEEERKKQEIEKEVQRRVNEELIKRNNLPVYSPVAFGNPLYSTFTSTPQVQRTIEPVDQEIEEIRRLVKETENRLRTLNDQDFEGSSHSTTLRTLAALGETAYGMAAGQRRDLINELKNILSTPSSNDSWHQRRTDPHVDLLRNSSDTYYGERSSRSQRESRRRSRSRSPHRSSRDERSTRMRESRGWESRSRRGEVASYRR